MILYADVGGTNTRVWKTGVGKITELIIGLRGVWTSPEKKRWRKKLRRIAPKITVLSDIELAHRLAFGKGPGVILNAGTGSIALGRNKQGKTIRAGGVGPLLGDEGSAFWIGREYLKRRYEQDGNLNHIRRYAVDAKAVAKIAGVAKQVLKRAIKNPKSIEADIVWHAQEHLTNLVNEVKYRLKLPASTPVSVTGGLFENPYFSGRWRKSRIRA